MKDFVFYNPTKVYFGKDQLHHLPDELKQFGKKVLLTYGGGSIKSTGLYDKVKDLLKDFEVYELSGIEPNPRHTSVNAGAAICKEKDIDVILAVGGGSVIDASKFMAAGRYYDGDTWDFQSKKAPIEKALPIVTILTLAATGSEMNQTGVISNMETNEKIGRNDPLIQPKVSFLDPTLTYSVSKYQTACGSADIFSHIMETYFSKVDGMEMLYREMEGLMKTVIHYAPIALVEPENYEARANLMWASSWAINGFVRSDETYSWQCHAMEHELSAFYDITHGLGLAILTPRWMEYIMDSKDALDRLVMFGVNVWDIDPTLSKEDIAKEAIVKMEQFFYDDLGLTDNLTELKITDEYFDRMAKSVVRKGPRYGLKDINEADAYKIFEACL